MKYLAYVLVSFVCSVVIAFIAINSGILQSQIENQVRVKTGLPVRLGLIQVAPKWPLTLSVGATEIPYPDLNLQLSGLQVSLANFSAPYDIRIQLLEPKVKLNGPLSAFNFGKAEASPAGPGGGSGSAPPQIRLGLNIVNGEFRSSDLALTSLNFEFAQKLWMSTRTPATLKASARVESSYLPGAWPISLQSDGLVFGDDAVKAQSVRATFAGLIASVQGTSLLKEGRHRWLAEVQAPDLSVLPQPPLEIPASNWQGALELQAEILKSGHGASWQASGNALARGVKAKVTWKKGKISIDGPVAVEMNGKFSYKDKKFSLPEFVGSVDLGAATVLAAEILSKPNNVPLRFDLGLVGDSKKIEIKKLEARLWQFIAKVTGSLTTAAPYVSSLTVDLAPTVLKGLEGLILPLKKSLVQGQTTALIEYAGPLIDPWASRILVKKFELKNFSADISYETLASVKAQGPFTASIDLHGEIDKGVPKTFQGMGQVQLGGLALVAGPMRKEPNQPLSASFNLKTEGQALQIEQMVIKGFLGEVRVLGRVSEPGRPKVDLRIEAKPLDLSEMRVAMPAFRETIPKGTVNGKVWLNGEMVFEKAWFDWPLSVGGDIKATLPEYRIVASPAVAGDVTGGLPPQGGGLAKPAQGFLPRGVLTEKLNLQVGAEVGVLQKDNLTVKGISAVGRIFKGAYVGGVTLREIFGGSVAFSNLSVPLFEALPLIQGNMALEQIVVQDALEFMKPEYKEMATGRAKGSASFATLMPSDARFMDELKSKGQITLEPITLNTVRLGQMLNDLIAKVPMLKLPPAKLDPLKGMVRMNYSLTAQTMSLAPLFARAEDTSELELKGKVALSSMQGDLVGNFMWAGSGVKGCFLEGNADAQGRMIIPVAIKGSLLEPHMSMVTNTANKLASRALECEKRKFVDKVKADGGESLKREGEKLLKGLLGK